MLQTANHLAPTDRLTAAIVQVYPRLLGLLFLYTFIQKLRGQEPLDAVLRFDGFPEAFIIPTRWLAIGIELVLAIMLITFRFLQRSTLITTILVLGLYTAQ